MTEVELLRDGVIRSQKDYAIAQKRLRKEAERRERRLIRYLERIEKVGNPRAAEIASEALNA